MSFPPLEEANRAPSNPARGFEGAFYSGGREKSEERGRGKEERDGRDGR